MTAIGPANLIKAQIKANLDALVVSKVLGGVIEQDININVLDLDFPGYPCAILGTSSMAANWEYQQANKRTYTFDVLVVQLQDNLCNNASIEDTRDAIALAFDDNVTLSGAAPLGVSAVFSERMPIASQGKNYVVFYVTIKATTLAGLTYNF